MKRMLIAAAALAVAVPAVAFGVAQADEVQRHDRLTGKDAKIANALSAAPEAVVRGARVYDYPAKATDPYVVLRKGKGAWTCFPDYLPSPGNDPYCFDRAGMQWLDAYYAGEKPNLKTPGIAYRLQGGSDPSLTDPFAVVPAKGGKWIEHGPHIVVFPAGKVDPKAYGKASHDGGGAWVMFPGSPYVHLHLPVGDAPAAHAH